jgi:lysine/ornithine N-monooxygenase
MESAYLIWILRCERVIAKDNSPFSEEEIESRWWKMMNERLHLDMRMTNKKFEKKAISKRLVKNTWKRLIQNENELPEDWVNLAGVLVGIEQDRRRRTGNRERGGNSPQ